MRPKKHKYLYDKIILTKQLSKTARDYVRKRVVNLTTNAQEISL